MVHPQALLSAFADDLVEFNEYPDESQLARCVASLLTQDGLVINEKARAFIERECCIDSNDLSVTSASLRSQIKNMFWKYLSTPETRSDLDTVAVEKFLTINSRLKDWHLAPNTSGDEELVGSVKELFWNFWNPQGFPLVTGLYTILDRGRVGPGVSVGALGEDFYTKLFSSSITYTSEVLLQAYLEWCDEDPTWASAESFRQYALGDCTRTHGSSLKFVPKDVRESRSIAVEPSLNMYYQLGLGSILEDRLKTFFGLDIRNQPEWNREAARVGSIAAQNLGRVLDPLQGETGDVRQLNADYSDFVTIDLKSASDSLGVNLMKCVLPDDFFRLLMRLRSDESSLPDGSRIELEMISTMGNGFTFPLETLLFSCVVVAAIKSLGLTPRRPSSNGALNLPTGNPAEWGVFGDDIVCHPHVAPRVLRLLALFGFEVNSNKTFVDGLFRESCGCDYFKGRDIRPVYLKKVLGTRMALHAAYNSFLEWSTRTGVTLPNVGRLLLTSLREGGWGDMPLFVPLAEGRDSGCRIPWNHVVDLASEASHVVAGIRQDADTKSALYGRLVPNAKQLRIGDGFVTVPKKAKARVYNPEGLLKAFLLGTVREGRISLRQGDTRYRKRECITPNWDYIPPLHDWNRSSRVRVDMGRLESASRAMLHYLV
jgi:hypothetical protein